MDHQGAPPPSGLHPRQGTARAPPQGRHHVLFSWPSPAHLRRARRPGILVLINDSDWELEGGLDYRLAPNDRIMLISTLHGG